ncbi:MAG: sugar phosphate isomerase/epimerase [Tannerellaceae bacterium]|jgi:sugar phosphate isomerase/epimerase|nr:sugar phosphate isomerase/epimerase [Tannerellaceae bacterium]
MTKALLATACLWLAFSFLQAQTRTVGNIHEQSRIKIALNFYSFNTPLLDGSETLESVIDYCSDTGFAAIDPTGYYFKGYPQVPSDAYINRIKYHAFRQGIQISGTGVRNDFTLPDAAAREKEKQLVKDWVVVAAKLGAPVVRIFTGGGVPKGYSRDEVARWVARDIDECGEFAKQYGIMLAVQNHNDFLKTAEEVEQLFALIRSEAVGLMIDIGSYRTDPYREIEQTVKYAVSWQIKEAVFINGVETPTDIPRVMDIIRRSGYRGYVPIETLGKGTERERVKRMYERLKGLQQP